MTRYWILAVATSVGVSALAAVLFPESSPPQEEKKIVLPAQDPDAVSRRDFMRTKLLYTQHIFEGLTTDDFDLIQSGISEVQMITEGEQWVAIEDEQYSKLTEEFKASTERLKVAAESGNIEATALRYYDMSNRCIDCHTYIRKAGYDL